MSYNERKNYLTGNILSDEWFTPENVVDFIYKNFSVNNICEVRGGHLRSGYTQSCGCLQKENREKYNNLRHKYKTMSLTKSGVLKGADNIE